MDDVCMVLVFRLESRFVVVTARQEPFRVGAMQTP
jgi:hypothetical protein